MRIGAVFPTTVIGSDVDDIRAFAAGAERVGFDHLITYDHVLGAPHDGRERPLNGPYDDSHEFHEPFVLFGFLAAATSTLGLTVGVLIAPQRQTALVAKQAAQVQLLSTGRLRLGLGTGWNWVEYESLGADFARRGAMLDEQVDLLRRLWNEPLVEFDGEFHHLDRAGLAPLPEPPDSAVVRRLLSAGVPASVGPRRRPAVRTPSTRCSRRGPPAPSPGGRGRPRPLRLRDGGGPRRVPAGRRMGGGGDRMAGRRRHASERAARCRRRACPTRAAGPSTTIWRPWPSG